MTIAKQDVLTPANFITVSGLVITTYGATRLNTLDGFIIVIIGKFLDVVDGFVARKTHTSDFGAAMDATADKITGFIILISALIFDMVTVGFIIFLLVQHLIVAGLSVFAALRGISLKVTKLGKRNMFLHLVTLFILIGSHFVKGSIGQFAWNIGHILILASIITGLATALDYLRTIFEAKPKRS